MNGQDDGAWNTIITIVPLVISAMATVAFVLGMWILDSTVENQRQITQDVKEFQKDYFSHIRNHPDHTLRANVALLDQRVSANTKDISNLKSRVEGIR